MNTVIDYAESRWVDLWLRHPVFGDPSFDSFERLPGNPIYRGNDEFAWPVNGFLFLDPVSRHWYVYVGDYKLAYGGGKSRCLLLRSTDRGQSWKNLGPVLSPDAQMFDKNGHVPDASVVYEDGRYHMAYDWGEPNMHADGGIAYAWADKPESPWHRASEPITRLTKSSALLGKYQRSYAATLIRRKNDWMILAMLDFAPHGWALFGMNSPNPGGPYSDRQLLRHVETDLFHPPLMEYYPSFAYDGYAYAPATSVALNRNFNVLFRAPLEEAMSPQAWKIHRHGSMWHAEDVENEAYGIWGQTISGQVDEAGVLQAMFNSRDAKGFGTVNLARRPWSMPLRERGFHFSGHQGSSLTCLRRAYREFRLDAVLQVRGVVSVLWDYHAPLGPDKPASNSTLHPLMRTRHNGVELSATGWRFLGVGDDGMAKEYAAGKVGGRNEWKLALERTSEGRSTLSIDGLRVWDGLLPTSAMPGAIGLLAEPNSHATVDRFIINGQPSASSLAYLCTEAILDHAEKPSDWAEMKEGFRYGLGIVAKQSRARVKWSLYGSGFHLWSPRGPEFGSIEIRLDGKHVAVVSLHSDQDIPSAPVWASAKVDDGPHAVVLEAKTGLLPVDCVEVTSE